jgi:hypothetical protein
MYLYIDIMSLLRERQVQKLYLTRRRSSGDLSSSSMRFVATLQRCENVKQSASEPPPAIIFQSHGQLGSVIKMRGKAWLESWRWIPSPAADSRLWLYCLDAPPVRLMGPSPFASLTPCYITTDEDMLSRCSSKMIMKLIFIHRCWESWKAGCSRS